MVYVGRLLIQLDEQTGGEFPISPVTGSFVLGLANMVGAYGTMLYVNKVGRKKIFVGGHIGMCISLAICGFCIRKELSMGTFVTLATFATFF